MKRIKEGSKKRKEGREGGREGGREEEETNEGRKEERKGGRSKMDHMDVKKQLRQKNGVSKLTSTEILKINCKFT